MVEMQPDGMGLIGDEVKIFDGNENDQVTIEGPKMYKRNGWYYIFAPAGGVKTGWQTVLRSKNVFGPYEYKVVMRQGDSPVNGPHQGAWVDTQTGEDWFLHFQDVYAGGRIVHLQPMHWENDWPVIGVNKPGNDYGEPVMEYKKPDIGKSEAELADKNLYPVCEPDTSDDFTGDKLGMQWQWNANFEDSWYSLENNQLKLNAVAASPLRPLGDLRNLLLQKWPAPEFCAETKMNLAELKDGDTAGYISLGMKYIAISVTNNNGNLEMKFVRGLQDFDCDAAYTDEKAEKTTVLKDADFTDANKTIWFRYKVNVKEHITHYELGLPVKDAPLEQLILEYSFDGVNYTKAIETEAKAGRWVGVKSGMFACHDSSKKTEAGYVTVDYVEYK